MEESKLESYGKHIPGILRRQIIAKLTQQYVERKSDDSTESPAIELRPSMERFHGALLFVDISGFTILSQRLNVDQLRLHINAYFKKILDIVEKHGGEAIKFAGDALFIVWQTQSTSVDPHSAAALRALRSAVDCGLEVNAECSNYEITLDPIQKPNMNESALLNGRRSSVVDPKSPSPDFRNKPVVDLAYLNVHSGVSMGLMAGIDVGANDRSEYLLLGDPLQDVAIAEGDAKSGDLVISDTAHAILHSSNTINHLKTLSEKNKIELPSLHDPGHLLCGCELTHSGYYKIKNNLIVDDLATECSEDMVMGESFNNGSFNNGSFAGDLDPNESFYIRPKQKTPTFGDSDGTPTNVLISSLMEASSAFGTIKEHIKTHFEEDLSKIAVVYKNNGTASFAAVGGEELVVAATNSQKRITHASFTIDEMVNNESITDLRVLIPDTKTHDEYAKAHNLNSNSNSLSNSRSSPAIDTVSSVVSAGLAVSKSTPTIGIAASGDELDMTMSSATSTEKRVEDLVKGLMSSAAVNAEHSQVKSAAHATGAEGAGAAGGENGEHTSSNHHHNHSPHRLSLVKRSPKNGDGGGDGGHLDNESVMSIIADNFMAWVQPCLVDDIVRHVHEADRTDYVFVNTPRAHSLETFINSHSTMTRGSKRRHTRGISYQNESIVKKLRNEVYTSNSVITNSKQYSGELRSVTVMFIKIDMTESKLFIDTAGGTHSAYNKLTANSDDLPTSEDALKVKSSSSTKDNVGSSAFHFLARTPLEKEHDNKLCKKFQECMEVMTKVFSEQGGQMRQFIVDDKGTVCIGTFGVRGAVNNDNAAAALQAGQAIIISLHRLGLNASIGVTSGKAYCGLVGSPTRHEFAVMGASTNLSARLMCRAGVMELLCDEEVKSRDRTHSFAPLGSVEAKGYAKPVAVFRPVFEQVMALLEAIEAERKKQEKAAKDAAAAEAAKLENKVVAEEKQEEEEKEGNAEAGVAPIVLQKRVKIAGRVKAKLQRAMLRSSSFFALHTTSSIAQAHHVHGRLEETKLFLQFFMPNTTVDDAFTKAFMNVDNNNSDIVTQYNNDFLALLEAAHPSGYLFNLHHKAKFIVVEGLNGIGKSQFIDCLMHKVITVNKITTKCNVSIYSNTATSFNKSILFYIWKSILIEMFIELGHIFTLLHDILLPHRDRIHMRQQYSANEMKRKILLGYGIDYVFNTLSPELQALRPLLTFIHVVEPDVMNQAKEAEMLAAMGQINKLERAVDLIVNIIQQYPILTNKSLVIYVSDIQFIDSMSLQVLQHVWLMNTGVTVICSCRSVSGNTENAHGGPSESTDLMPVVKKHDVLSHSALPFYSMFETMSAESNRYLKIELFALSPNEIRGMVCDIFKVSPTCTDEESPEYIDPSVFTKIYSMSGGNPLYAVEIAKAMLHNLEAMEHQLHQEQLAQGFHHDEDKYSTSPDRKKFSELLVHFNGFSINRIDEIICYRFDQLDSISQYFMKVASVACCYSKSFTLPMITYMMDNSTEDDEIDGKSTKLATFGDESVVSHAATDIAWILFSILKSNEFIRIKENVNVNMKSSISSSTMASFSAHTSDDPESPQERALKSFRNIATNAEVGNFEASSLSLFEYEFCVEMEQSVIYGLMLNDQKAFLHCKIANYLRNRALEKGQGGPIRRPSVMLNGTGELEAKQDIAELIEEGNHWKEAGKFDNAMCCYYHSSCVLDTLGAAEEQIQHLLHAYNNFNSMRTAAGIIVDDTRDPTEFPELMKVRNVAPATTRRRQSVSSNRSPANVNATKLVSEMKASDLFHIFNGDSDVMEVALNVMVKLGVVLTDMHVVCRLFDEALQIIILIIGSHSSSNSHHSINVHGSSPTTNSPESASPTSAGGHILEELENDLHKHTSMKKHKFEFKNPKICFPLLSTIIEMFKTGVIPDDNRAKISSIVALYVHVAMSDESLKAFYIRGLCLVRNLHCESRRIHEMCTISKEIRDTYKVEQHSHELTKYYLFDLIPHTLVANIQVLDFTGDIEQLNIYVHLVHSILPKIKHLNTLGLAAISLISTAVAFGKKSVGYEICVQYLAFERKSRTIGYFQDLFLLYKEYCICSIQYDKCLQASAVANHSHKNHNKLNFSLYESAYNAEMLESIMDGSYMAQHELRKYAYIGTTYFHPEYVCAQICFLKAKSVMRLDVTASYVLPDNREEVVRYLQKAFEYNAIVLKKCSALTYFLYSQIASHLLQAEILLFLSKCEEAGPSQTQYKSELLATLKNLEIIASTSHSVVVSMITGACYEQWEVDEAHGMVVQDKAFAALIKVNGEHVSRGLVAKYVEKYPVLSRLLQQKNN